MERWKRFIVLGCFSLGLVSATILGYSLRKSLTNPMMAGGSAPVIFLLDKNTSAAKFAHILKSKGLIQSEYTLLVFIRAKGLAPRLKAGIYAIHPNESVVDLLYRIVAGDVLTESFTIIEGTTLDQVKANLGKARFLTYDTQVWQLVDINHSSLEGLLLADTYHYDASSDAKYLLRLANSKLTEYLEYSWKNRSPGLPYKSSYELLVAASILEKESAIPTERKLISGIVVNRLKKNMPLQMDPTVIYALGPNYHGKLMHDDLAINSPYNTYRYRGLPPTPIAMVGKESIDAAAHPQITDYLYFVSKGNGSHEFSISYDDQRKAISRYNKRSS